MEENFCVAYVHYKSGDMRIELGPCAIPAKRRMPDCCFFQPKKGKSLSCRFRGYVLCTCDAAIEDARIDALRSARDAMHEALLTELRLQYDRRKELEEADQ